MLLGCSNQGQSGGLGLNVAYTLPAHHSSWSRSSWSWSSWSWSRSSRLRSFGK